MILVSTNSAQVDAPADPIAPGTGAWGDSARAVVVASDVRLYGEGLKLVLAADGRLRVAHIADTAEGVVGCVTTGSVDALLLHAELPDARGALREVRAHSPAIPIVIFGVPERDDDLLDCIEAGATAFVSRDASAQELIETLLSAIRGEPILSPRSAGQLIRRLASRARMAGPVAAADELTSREREIGALLDTGLSNKEIAQRLRISVATVKNHVHRILEKLHVQRRGQAASRLRKMDQRI